MIYLPLYYQNKIWVRPGQFYEIPSYKSANWRNMLIFHWFLTATTIKTLGFYKKSCKTIELTNYDDIPWTLSIVFRRKRLAGRFEARVTCTRLFSPVSHL